MLAVFCDLEPQWHREFREWLRDDMMPARMKIGFPACASYDLMREDQLGYGSPEPFVTVYEAASLGDLYGTPYQRLRANRDARDKAFHARFLSPARFTLSWVGPELAATGSGAGFAPIAVFDRFEIPASRIQDFNLAYVTEYLPKLSGVPELRRVRRYLAMEGEPRHVVVHELEAATALQNHAWLEARQAINNALAAADARTAGVYTRVLGLTL